MRDGIGCLRRGEVGRHEGWDCMSENGSWLVEAGVWVGEGSGRDDMGRDGLFVEWRVGFTVWTGLDVEEGVERVRGAIERHQRVLTKTSRTMTVGEPHDSAWTSYKLALGEDVMRRFSGELVRAGIVVSTLQAKMPGWMVCKGSTPLDYAGCEVHSAVAIPPHTRMDTRDHGQLVKAAPDERKFSNIRIQGGGAESYGKLLILFQFTGPDGAKVQRAFVKYYDEVSPPCPVTGCLRLVPTTGEDEYSVIEVDSILALAHIVPSFTHDDMLLVNRFLF
ncbi:unnamed protein product [Closterium sp. NIES-65]|nr:unnamed protein product [Closterium sp. NIES-65]